MKQHDGERTVMLWGAVVFKEREWKSVKWVLVPLF
jgi:hypothetical protein